MSTSPAMTGGEKVQRFSRPATPLEEIVARYPRLIAHMVCESLGYLTPLAAANAPKHHVLEQPFACEWYIHMAGWGREGLLAVNRSVVEMAFRRRHHHSGYIAHYPTARAIVAEALRRHPPAFASWP